MKNLAQGISLLFHPLLLPTFTFALLFYGAESQIMPIRAEAKPIVLLFIFLFTFVLPSFSTLVFYFTGNIKSLAMQDRRDRPIPFLITTFYYAVATYLFAFTDKFQSLPLLGVIIGSVTLAILLTTFITFSWKISAHSIGMSGIVGFLMGLSYQYADTSLLVPTALAIIFAGALMSARLYLNAHTPDQVLAGCFLGFFLSFFSIIWFG